MSDVATPGCLMDIPASLPKSGKRWQILPTNLWNIMIPKRQNTHIGRMVDTEMSLDATKIECLKTLTQGIVDSLVQPAGVLSKCAIPTVEKMTLK